MSSGYCVDFNTRSNLHRIIWTDSKGRISAYLFKWHNKKLIHHIGRY